MMTFKVISDSGVARGLSFEEAKDLIAKHGGTITRETDYSPSVLSIVVGTAPGVERGAANACNLAGFGKIREAGNRLMTTAESLIRAADGVVVITREPLIGLTRSILAYCQTQNWNGCHDMVRDPYRRSLLLNIPSTPKADALRVRTFVKQYNLRSIYVTGDQTDDIDIYTMEVLMELAGLLGMKTKAPVAPSPEKKASFYAVVSMRDAEDGGNVYTSWEDARLHITGKPVYHHKFVTREACLAFIADKIKERNMFLALSGIGTNSATCTEPDDREG